MSLKISKNVEKLEALFINGGKCQLVWYTSYIPYVENNMAFAKRVSNITIWSCNSTSEYIPKRLEGRWLDNHVHRSNIYNNQKR
jgi:DNA modification methylase